MSFPSLKDQQPPLESIYIVFYLYICSFDAKYIAKYAKYIVPENKTRFILFIYYVYL